MNNTKLNYFYNRKRTISNSNTRELLGLKEIVTISTMLNKFNNMSKSPEKIDFFKGKRILDIGCGDKFLQNSIKRYGGEYIGIDIDNCNLENEKTDFEDDYFDMVICLALIEHLFDPGNLLEEIKRVLKKDSPLILSTPDINASKTHFWNDPTHIHPYNPISMRSLLKMFSFKGVKVVPNYRCKSKFWYSENSLIFFISRILPFKGSNKLPFLGILKGNCKGMFAIAFNP